MVSVLIAYNTLGVPDRSGALSDTTFKFLFREFLHFECWRATKPHERTEHFGVGADSIV